MKHWIGFIAMSVGMFMAILDTQIVASSLPEIQVGLHIPFNQLSWVQTAYLIAEIVAIPLTGWLTRLLSTRGAFVGAVIGFTVASVACAASTSFWALIVARVIQGFCGGFLIPVVFSVVFLMFQPPARTVATVIAGLMAMLAPSLGPAVGGLVTDTLSWHWLFLINVGPGIIVAALVAWCIAIDRPDWKAFASVDLAALPLLAACLGTLQIILKEAPQSGWHSPLILALSGSCLATGVMLIQRCLHHRNPLIDLGVFRDRNFVIGSWFSFVLGIGIYGATYLLPVFLGVIRGFEALQIGEIMLVTGVAQLVMAPVATILERRTEGRLLSATGFALLAIGFLSDGFLTVSTQSNGLFWPQIARGFAFMLCLLPITSLALGNLAPERVANASGLFNLMRNLGGAIGLAIVDTILEQRTPTHAKNLAARLMNGDADAARIVGVATDRFKGVPLTDVDQATRDLVRPLVEQAGLVQAFNESWLLIGAIILLSVLALPFLKPIPPPEIEAPASK